MGSRKGGGQLPALGRMFGVLGWGKILILLACCGITMQSAALDAAEKLALSGLLFLLLGMIIMRGLRAQQQVETEGGLLMLRTLWGGEKTFPLREVAALTYTASTLTLRGEQGERLCRLDRRRWNMDPLLEDLAACGQRSRAPYVVGAGKREKIQAVFWLALAAANSGLWIALYVISREEHWEAGALLLLALLCVFPLVWALINLRIRLVRRLKVEEKALHYFSAWGGKGREISWQEVYWIAQPGGQAHLLRRSTQRKTAVLSGKDQHLYELLCDLYAHAVETAEQRKVGMG